MNGTDGMDGAPGMNGTDGMDGVPGDPASFPNSGK